MQDQEIADFRQAWSMWGEYPILAHDSYLINLASPDAALRQRSVQPFALELERCARLGIAMMVTHPGACRGRGRKQGLCSLRSGFCSTIHSWPECPWSWSPQRTKPASGIGRTWLLCAGW